MKTIWKYKLQVIDKQEIEMPDNAELLTVQVQRGVPCLWVKVDPNIPTRTYGIATYGTGHPIHQDNQKYIDTYIIDEGALVFHVFEIQ